VPSCPAVAKDPLPQVYLTAAAVLSLQVTLNVHGSLCADRSGAETTLREEAHSSFRERGGPVLQWIVHVKSKMS
jgi:small-conductance mechanosensitive channel